MSFFGGIHNVNYVCITCRLARRSSSIYDICKCTKCGERMQLIGYKIEVPKKNKEAEWKKFIIKYGLDKPKRKTPVIVPRIKAPKKIDKITFNEQ